MRQSAPSPTPLSDALAYGNVDKLPDNVALLAAIRQELALRDTEQTDLLNQVWGNDAISYAPGYNSQMLKPLSMRESDRTYALLVGSAGRHFGIAGTVQAARVAAFGSNVIGNMQAGSAPTMVTPMRRLLSWLMTGQQQDIGAARTISLVRFGSGDQTNLMNWFKAQYPAWSVTACTDDTQLASCTQGSQLVLVGSRGTALNDANAAVLAFLNQSLAAGVPLMYLHTAGWPEGGLPQIAELLGAAPLPYSGNYFSTDSAGWTSQGAMAAAQPMALQPMQAVSRLVEHLDAGDYTFDLSQCPDDNRCGAAPGITTEFYQGAEQVQAWIAAVETAGRRLFRPEGPTLLKELVLLGDYYRRDVRYPMSKTTTPVNTFMRALFTDYAMGYSRNIQPAANLDGSSFSPVVPASAPAVTVDRSFTTRSTDFTTSAAVYALPGRPYFTVKRLDNSPAKIWVFVNQLRSGAGHIFGSKYDRPKYLWGNAIPLEPGTDLRLNHPYGGLIYVRMQKTDTPADVQLQFIGVGKHAAYTGPESAASFAADVSSNPLGWAEILTPSFEIHSSSAKMQQSISRYNNDVNLLLSDIETYIYRDIYNLAGFAGRDLALTQGAAAFCQQNGWDCTSPAIHGLAGIQHYNADQANCGSLCSGQPIDSWSAFHPLGWGESHEVGHNLQNGHFKIYGGQSGEVSNNIFPTHKWLQYNRANPSGQQYGRDLQQKATFELLQAAQRVAPEQAVGHVKNGLWYSEGLFWGRLLFYWQAALDNRDVLGDEGWDLYRLLYLHDRLLSKALANDTTWSTERAKLGFGSAAYASRSAAQNIGPEDYMLVVMSHITRRDQRNFFDMWGVRYSANAAGQVASYAYPATSKRYWVIPCESKAFKAPLATPVAVDGQGTWPAAGNCTP